MISFEEFKVGCPLRKNHLCSMDTHGGFLTRGCEQKNCVGYYSYRLAYKEFKEKIEDRWEELDGPKRS